MVSTITALLILVLIYTSVFTTAYILSDEFIELINQKQTTWRAGRNFHPDTDYSYLKKIASGIVQQDYPSYLPMVRHTRELINGLPENFDPRENWPNCPTLKDIRDQGACGSCWVFGAVEAMTDRYCIHSNGSKQFYFSADDVLSCNIFGGCDGGNPLLAWLYWRYAGVVSGGGYNSSQGCLPYRIPPCEHGNAQGNRKLCKDEKYSTPKCLDKCQPEYRVDLKADKRYGTSVYFIDKNEDQIKAELFKNGPVEAGFRVYADFINYKSGVYNHTEGEKLGNHAVKMLGWGVENGVKYWLIANSWNTDWGDNGYFKILRGEDHCGIESIIVAGEPKLED